MGCDGTKNWINEEKRNTTHSINTYGCTVFWRKNMFAKLFKLNLHKNVGVNAKGIREYLV